MENQTSTPKNYSFIAVPTNLYFALDNNLRTALTVLIQLSSVFADSDGYFFRSNEDLRLDFKMGKNLTIGCLESLYQYGLLSVRSEGFTRKGGKKTINYFKVNTEKFKDFEDKHLYEITKNETLHLNTIDYKAKDFKVTYTSTTENGLTSPSSVPTEEIPSQMKDNGSEGLKTALNETVEDKTQIDEHQELLEGFIFSDIYGGECPLLDSELAEAMKPSTWRNEVKEPIDELDEILGEDEAPAMKKVIKKVIPTSFERNLVTETVETASLKPSDSDRIETRSIIKVSDSKVDEKAIGNCYTLVQRFQQQPTLTMNEVEDKFKIAWDYIYLRYQKGMILESDWNRLKKCLLDERYKRVKL